MINIAFWTPNTKCYQLQTAICHQSTQLIFLQETEWEHIHRRTCQVWCLVHTHSTQMVHHGYWSYCCCYHCWWLCSWPCRRWQQRDSPSWHTHWQTQVPLDIKWIFITLFGLQVSPSKTKICLTPKPGDLFSFSFFSIWC